MTQPALFPDEAVVGTGRPHPWPLPGQPEVDQDTAPQQADELPLVLDGDGAP
jgi:hypothetical protein